MASGDKISIPIGLDTSGVSADIQKVSQQVGKATVGVARGVSAAMGQALGPFGELIEKADALKMTFDGITAGSKLMAIGIGAAAIAAVYGVNEAVKAYGEMSDAIDEAVESQKRLNATQNKLGASIGTGIAAGQEENAVKKIDARIAELEKQSAEQIDISGPEDSSTFMVSALTPAKISENAKMIAELKAERAKVLSGEATAKGEARLGLEMLDPATRKAMEEAQTRQNAASAGTSSLETFYAQRQAAQNRLAEIAGGPITQNSSLEAKGLTIFSQQLDKLISALESLKTIEEKKQAASDAEEGSRSGAGAETTWNDGSRGYVGGAGSRVPGGSSGVPMGYGVGGYTNVGGGGNIYGNRAGAEERFKSIDENVEKIADVLTSGTNQLLTT